MKSKVALGMFLLLALLMTRSVGAVPPLSESKDEGENHSSVWMKMKLEYSKRILEGLAQADFDKIVESAEGMQKFSRFEGLLRRKSPSYTAQLEIFKDANAELIKQANRDNLDGATLAFTQLTISCVNCHKRIREESK